MRNYNYKKLVFCFVVVSCTNTSKTNNNIEIIPLPPYYTRYFTDMHSSMRGDFFAIKNLKSLDSATMNKTDFFVEKFYKTDFDTFGNFTLNFYKYGKIVNETLTHDPNSDRSIALYDRDLLLSYEWHNGKYSGTIYYSDGKIIKCYEHRKIIIK